MNWKCFFGFHKWTRLGGASNVGEGKFRIRLICEKCKKVKEIIK